MFRGTVPRRFGQLAAFRRVAPSCAILISTSSSSLSATSSPSASNSFVASSSLEGPLAQVRFIAKKKAAKKGQGSSPGGEVSPHRQQRREVQRKSSSVVKAKTAEDLPPGISSTAPCDKKAASKNTILELQNFCTPEPLVSDAFPSAVDSTGVWRKILAVLKQDKKVCLLRGGCQTGKTSLYSAGRFLSGEKKCKFMADKELRYVYGGIDTAPTQKNFEGMLSIEEATERKNLFDENLILVIDEAHAWFACEESSREGNFIKILLKINVGRKCSVLFMTTSTVDDARPKGVTPVELKDRQLWFVGPTSDRTHVEKYIEFCLTKENPAALAGTKEGEERTGELTEGATFVGDGDTQEEVDIVKIATKSLFEMCGCNIGLVSAALRELQKTNSLSPFQLHDCRALMGGNGGLSPEEKEVVMELLALGKVEIDMRKEDKDSPGKELVRKGYLVPFGLERSSDRESVHDFDEGTKEFTFANALQAERMRGLLPNRMELKQDTQYASALDFVFALLPAMPSWCFVSSASDPESSSQLLEASLQHGASVAAASLGVQPFVEVASRSRARRVGRPPAVDLVVKSPRFANEDTNYAIELLSDGSIDKHQEYFRNSGQHSRYTLRRGQCVVLSFHTSYNEMYEKLSAAKKDIPVVAVAPHLRFGWSFYSLAYFDGTDIEELTIPRHGIPFDRKGNSLTIYRKPESVSEVWVSVTLPDKTVEAVDITSRVKNAKEISPNISGLKEVVKKRLADELQGIGVSRLMVYPPGKKKAGKALGVGDALKSAPEAEPYHVEVGSSSGYLEL